MQTTGLAPGSAGTFRGPDAAATSRAYLSTPGANQRTTEWVSAAELRAGMGLGETDAVQFGGVTVDGDLEPLFDNGGNLGTESKRWTRLRVASAVYSPAITNPVGSMVVGQSDRSTFVRGGAIYLDPSGNLSDAIRVNAHAIQPYNGATMNAGSTSDPFVDVFGIRGNFSEAVTTPNINLNATDTVSSPSAGTVEFDSPYANTLKITSGQSGQSAGFDLHTAEGKKATVKHYDVANAKGRLLEISSQPGVPIAFAPGGVDSVSLDPTTGAATFSGAIGSASVQSSKIIVDASATNSPVTYQLNRAGTRNAFNQLIHSDVSLSGRGEWTFVHEYGDILFRTGLAGSESDTLRLQADGRIEGFGPVHIKNSSAAGSSPAANDFLAAEDGTNVYVNLITGPTRECGLLLSATSRAVSSVVFNHNTDILTLTAPTVKTSSDLQVSGSLTTSAVYGSDGTNRMVLTGDVAQFANTSGSWITAASKGLNIGKFTGGFLSNYGDIDVGTYDFDVIGAEGNRLKITNSLAQFSHAMAWNGASSQRLNGDAWQSWDGTDEYFDGFRQTAGPLGPMQSLFGGTPVYQPAAIADSPTDGSATVASLSLKVNELLAAIRSLNAIPT